MPKIQVSASFPTGNYSCVFANLDMGPVKQHPFHTDDVTKLDPTRDCFWANGMYPDDGKVDRKKHRVIGVTSVVIDDVGSRYDASTIRKALGEPTSIVETSEQNFQWTYSLTNPVLAADWPAYIAEIEYRVGPGLDGKGLHGKDAGHLFRLPMGINSKDAPGRRGFKVRTVALKPENKMDPAKFPFTPRVVEFNPGVELDPARFLPGKPEPRIRNIRGIVALLPNNTSYPEWIERMHQIRALAIDPEQGREAFREFTARWSGGSGDDADAKWDTMHGDPETTGLELLKAAEAANPKAFARIMNAEANPVFDDGVDVVAETAELRGDGAEAYPPTHTAMRDMILRREKGWLGWLSNAPQRWAAFDGALGRWSIGETDAAMRSAVRKEITARKRLPVEAKVAKEMSRAAWALAVHALLKHHSMLEIPRHQFNADPDLLGVPGSAVRLGLQLQTEAGRPDHMLSKATRFAVGPRGRTGRAEWDRFVLEFCSGDQGLVRWLQTFCGYCLTGHTTEHVMLFLYGPGGNGKSLFLDTIGSVMGDYHQRADHRLFMAKSGNFHLAPLAALEGARLVTCPDVPHNATWDMGLVKLVTGGGSITANYMRENPFSFFPECKLILAGNDKPKLESVDEGVRRRLRLVPCLNVPAAIDRGLPDKLLREGEGILRWMVEGWEMWSQFGLPACRIVDEATDEYLLASDVFGRWLRDEIVEAAGSQDRVRVGDLWRSWDAFRCREGAMRAHPNDQGSLSTRLRERGVGTRGGKDRHGAYFTGITMKKTPEGVF